METSKVTGGHTMATTETKKKTTDNHKKILSDKTKLKVAIEFLKELITADETGQSNGRSKEKIKSEVITFINELI